MAPAVSTLLQQGPVLRSLEQEADGISLLTLQSVRDERQKKYMKAALNSARPEFASGRCKPPTVPKEPNLADSLAQVLKRRPSSAAPSHSSPQEYQHLRNRHEALLFNPSPDPLKPAILSRPSSVASNRPPHSSMITPTTMNRPASALGVSHTSAPPTSKSFGRPASAVPHTHSHTYPHTASAGAGVGPNRPASAVARSHINGTAPSTSPWMSKVATPAGVLQSRPASAAAPHQHRPHSAMAISSTTVTGHPYRTHRRHRTAGHAAGSSSDESNDETGRCDPAYTRRVLPQWAVGSKTPEHLLQVGPPQYFTQLPIHDSSSSTKTQSLIQRPPSAPAAAANSIAGRPASAAMASTAGANGHPQRAVNQSAAHSQQQSASQLHAHHHGTQSGAELSTQPAVSSPPISFRRCVSAGPAPPKAQGTRLAIASDSGVGAGHEPPIITHAASAGMGSSTLLPIASGMSSTSKREATKAATEAAASAARSRLPGAAVLAALVPSPRDYTRSHSQQSPPPPAGQEQPSADAGVGTPQLRPRSADHGAAGGAPGFTRTGAGDSREHSGEEDACVSASQTTAPWTTTQQQQLQAATATDEGFPLVPAPMPLHAFEKVELGRPTVVDKLSEDHDAHVAVAIHAARESHILTFSGQATSHSLPAQLVRFLRAEGMHLASLVLPGNRLLSAPPLELTPSLTHLDLSDNHLGELPSTVGLLTQLTQLSLDNNRLAALPDSLTTVTTLTSLSTNRNRLAVLPRGLGALQGLRQLKASHNLLQGFPASTSGLTALQRLDASHNEITALPPGFGSLVTLAVADLSHNQLTALPASIGGLHRSLGTLHLHHNHLSVLPRELAFLTTLSHVTLGDNPLIFPPTSVASQGAQAVRLYLSTNASALTSSATATLSHDPLPSSMTAVAERPELQSSSQVAQAPASQDEQQDVLAVASAGGVCEAMSGTGNRGSNGGQAEGRSSSCSKCDALVLELEEQGALLLSLQLEHEASQQRAHELQQLLEHSSTKVTQLEQEAQLLVKEVRGAVPAPDLFSGGSALGADPVELAREVRRLHTEVRRLNGELSLASQRLADAEEGAAQERVRAKAAAVAAGSAERNAAEAQRLQGELSQAVGREQALQERVTSLLADLKAAEDRCLEAEAQLDALKLGTLDGLQAEVAVLRQDARDKSAAMHEAEHWAAAREAALLNQISALQASLDTLLEERRALHEATESAAKVHAVAAAKQMSAAASVQVYAHVCR